MAFVGLKASAGSLGIEAVIAGASTTQIVVGGAVIVGSIIGIKKLVESVGAVSDVDELEIETEDFDPVP